MPKTYHSTNGRFCPPDAAKTVIKDGERFKVVRQHRRLKPKKEALERPSGSDRWIPLPEVIAAFGVVERSDRPRISRPQKCKYCDSPANKAMVWADGRAYVPVCGDEHLAKARKQVGEHGVATQPIPVD